jgi:EAL domain-containing protein (putative c-di-GMP-specific phosphodiesterase class I)
MLSSTASIGLVLADGQDRSTLLRQADIAMYAAKARGGDGTAVFDVELHSELLARHHREVELRGAAARGELVLEYQPVMHLARNEMVGVEALVRWQHPVHGRIPPLQFIPLAEESGSIKQIGAWVLEQACRQALAWDAEHPLSPPLDIAVNLSPRQLVDDGLVEVVRNTLEQVAIDPARVTLEVTESALGGDTEMMISKLDQLKALGVRLAIDDFGTGYSSLSFLRRLPVDILKIDKSFVDGIAREPEEWALTTAIVKLASSLGKQTLAEGIELGEQLAHLRALSCELGQGYLFDRPLPAAMVSERIAAASFRRAGTVQTDART